VLTKPADGKAKDGKLAEIPIPEIRKVSSYESDYRPNYVPSETYLRNRTFGAPPEDIVEYDLDNDDEDWLTEYNDGQNRLPAEKLESMIWKLEIHCGEANEIAMEITAAAATEKGQIISYQDKCAAMAGTSALPKEKALELLKDMSGRPAIMEAVYDYWCEKRKRTGKPCLRRLQPPPAPNDANPFNVFRQREKTNRPQTRRRRENDGGSFDKMRQIRKHMEMVYAVAELQLLREQKKAERCRSECDSQALQIKLKHEPRTLHEEIEEEFSKRPSCAPLRPEELEWNASKSVTLPLSRVEIVMRSDGTYGFGGERFAPPPALAGINLGGQKPGSKKRRRDEIGGGVPTPRGHPGLGPDGGSGRYGGFPGNGAVGSDGGPVNIGYSSPFGSTPAQIQLAIDRMGPPRALLPIEPVAAYQPPPEIPDIEMLFARAPDIHRLKRFVLPLGTHKQHCRPRIARGGRVVFDRKDPLTREPYFQRDRDDLRDMDADGADENERTPTASVRA
jgi:enhancer of polycomb-like protein